MVLLCSGYRLLDRASVWLSSPHDDMLLVEAERKVRFAALHPRHAVPCATRMTAS